MTNDTNESQLRGCPSVGALGYSLEDLHMSILRVFHAQRAQLRPFGASLGLGPGQPKLLSYLAVRGSATQRDIADYFGIDPAAVCRMLDVLERNGFVRSAANPADRRTKVLALTEAGRVAVRAWDERCREVEAQMLAGFTPGEAAQLRVLLDRVRRNLRDGAAPHADLAPDRPASRASEPGRPATLAPEPDRTAAQEPGPERPASRASEPDRPATQEPEPGRTATANPNPSKPASDHRPREVRHA